MSGDFLQQQTELVLAEAVFRLVVDGAWEQCDAMCPACRGCSYVGNREMFGTECIAVIHAWAQGVAREMPKPRTNSIMRGGKA